jgi:hypothetical protein
MNNWQLIGKVKPPELIESRLQLHYAIQFIAATGAALAEPLPDYSHTSLVWNPTLEIFVGPAIRAAQSFQVALDPTNLMLILSNRQNKTIAALPLDGKTMAEGLNWLKQEIANMEVDPDRIVFLDYPADDFSDHALAHGATFDASQDLGLSELADYYANTHLLLQTVLTDIEDSSSIRIWPHHFDMASLIMLPSNQEGISLTIGVGLSPGDASYNEPYWYVSPYPYPGTASLPALDGYGVWHTQHWVGAVLLASELAKHVNAEAQSQQVTTFLKSALGASTTLLQLHTSAKI